MEKKNWKKDTKHHIIPRCNRELFDNLNSTENIHIWHEKPHTVHHAWQAGKHPQQTLEDYRFFTRVMSPKAKELYEVLINMRLDEFYDKKFISDD